MTRIIVREFAHNHYLEVFEFRGFYSLVVGKDYTKDRVTIHVETSKQRIVGVLYLVIANPDVFFLMKKQAQVLKDMAIREAYEIIERETK